MKSMELIGDVTTALALLEKSLADMGGGIEPGVTVRIESDCSIANITLFFKTDRLHEYISQFSEKTQGNA
jgi:hypothetical protein